MTTTRARLNGAAALATIAGLVVGIPLLLLGIGADPVPDTIPSWDQLTAALTSPDDGTLAMTAITLVGWLAWAFLTAAIALEVASRLRRVPTPHLPGLALPQAAARSLVGAAVLLLVAAPTTIAPRPTPPQHHDRPPGLSAPPPASTSAVAAAPTPARAAPARDHQRTARTPSPAASPSGRSRRTTSAPAGAGPSWQP